MMARLMFSAGMLTAFAAVTAVRRRGFISGSPPLRAAIMISLMMRVNALPRLASRAAFLCLMVAHFECPDIVKPLSRGEPDTVRISLGAGAPTGDWIDMRNWYLSALSLILAVSGGM